MKERLYLIDLYDLYQNLLTDKQKDYFEDYYYNNLTLSEISENNEVSRSAVQKAIKEIEQKLTNYETKLNLYDKKEKIKNIISDENLLNKILEVLGD